MAPGHNQPGAQHAGDLRAQPEAAPMPAQVQQQQVQEQQVQPMSTPGERGMPYGKNTGYIRSPCIFFQPVRESLR